MMSSSSSSLGDFREPATFGTPTSNRAPYKTTILQSSAHLFFGVLPERWVAEDCEQLQRSFVRFKSWGSKICLILSS